MINSKAPRYGRSEIAEPLEYKFRAPSSRLCAIAPLDSSLIIVYVFILFLTIPNLDV